MRNRTVKRALIALGVWVVLDEALLLAIALRRWWQEWRDAQHAAWAAVAPPTPHRHPSAIFAPTSVGTAVCPYCDVGVEDSAVAEIEHMEAEHPNIIVDRLCTAGMQPETDWFINQHGYWEKGDY